MTKKLLTTAAIILACTNLANAGSHGSHAKATTPGHSSGEIYDDMYVTLFGGVTMPQKFTGLMYQNYASPKNGFTFGAGVGYHVDRNIRTELTLQKLDFSAEANDNSKNITNKYENLAVFANGFFDLVTFNKLTPYLTAGVGFVNTKPSVKTSQVVQGVKYNDKTKGKSKSNFAWNIGAGFRHDFRDNITLDIGYKYLDFGSIKFDRDRLSNALNSRSGTYDTFNTKLNAHTFNVGVAYNF